MLDQYAPNKRKKKIQRANHKPYVTKAMWKAIMKRSKLAKKYRTRAIEENKKAFKKQRNFCNRYKKRKIEILTDNKKF